MPTAKKKATTPKTKISMAERARNVLLISVGITILLYIVPMGEKVAYPLILISTMFHELGHGVAAIISGNDFHSFVMNSDGSGVALLGFTGDASFAKAFTSAGGLCGPAIGAAMCFAFARKTSWSRYTLFAMGILLLVAEVMVVRNQFGLIFVGVFAAACLFLAAKANDDLVQLSLVFLGVQLALSVYSRGDYLFTRSAGSGPSDVENMSRALGLPYWFWGGTCAVFSALALLCGTWLLLRRDNKSLWETIRG